jgi:hypothetical protein
MMATLLSELPQIRRARDFHLYDHRGRRYLDLYLQDGRALLGHRPERVLLHTKNMLSKGLSGDFPSVFERRLAKALAPLLPDHPVIRIYRNQDRLVRVLTEHLGTAAPVDPALEDPAGKPVALWRPFLDSPACTSAAGRAAAPPVLIPVIPFPGSFAPAVACFREPPGGSVPDSDLLSPALLAALCEAMYALGRFAARAERAYAEEHWRTFDAPLWERRGPYLRCLCNKGQYPAFFRRSLEKGILIAPDFPGPSIIPAEASAGERALFEGLSTERDWR